MGRMGTNLDPASNSNRLILNRRTLPPREVSRSTKFVAVARGYLDEHERMPRPTYASVPSPTHSALESCKSRRKTDMRIQKTSGGCHVQPKMLSKFIEGSPHPNLKHHLIDPLYWNPLVVVSRLDSDLDQEVARLQNLILDIEYPKTYLEERELFQTFWKILLSSQYITLVGDFFIGPNGTYYKPSVRFNNRKEWMALQLQLKTFNHRREGGRSWEPFIWQQGETVTAKRAAAVIRKELLKPQCSNISKPCVAILESLINQNKHGLIEKSTKKGKGYQWKFNRHSWSIVARLRNTLSGSKGLELVKIDSLFPKLRKKDIQFSGAISVPIQGFFVRSEIGDVIPDYKCILESFLIAIRILLKGDDCRKTD